jgi:hypothetical protein
MCVFEKMAGNPKPGTCLAQTHFPAHPLPKKGVRPRRKGKKKQTETSTRELKRWRGGEREREGREKMTRDRRGGLGERHIPVCKGGGGRCGRTFRKLVTIVSSDYAFTGMVARPEYETDAHFSESMRVPFDRTVLGPIWLRDSYFAVESSDRIPEIYFNCPPKFARRE